MKAISKAGAWHGQVLGFGCPKCRKRELMVDEHFARIVCLACWAITEYGAPA